MHCTRQSQDQNARLSVRKYKLIFPYLAQGNYVKVSHCLCEIWGCPSGQLLLVY